MTIVGSKRMIVYDDVSQLEKIRIFDARVERPPHYDTFAEFHYAYHYGDVHVPYIKQEEPLKTECQHFLDCIRTGTDPMSSGEQGLRLVRILESASASLKNGGAPVSLVDQDKQIQTNGNGNGNGNGSGHVPPRRPPRRRSGSPCGGLPKRNRRAGRLGNSG